MEMRRKNLNIPGHAHELTFTCYRRYPFLAKDRTQAWLAQSVNDACQKHSYALVGYVFMPEHVHLLVWPKRPTYDIAVFRKSVKEPVGRKAIGYLEEHAPHWLEKVTRQRGRRVERLFWQSGGGFDRNVDDPCLLLTMLDYLHANPIRRGLVKVAEDWPWSSAAWYMKGESGPCVVDAEILSASGRS